MVKSYPEYVLEAQERASAKAGRPMTVGGYKAVKVGDKVVVKYGGNVIAEPLPKRSGYYPAEHFRILARESRSVEANNKWMAEADRISNHS